MFSKISEYIFNNKNLSWTYRLKLRQSNKKIKKKKSDYQLKNAFSDLLYNLKSKKDLELKEKLEISYDKIADITDTFFSVVFNTISKDLSHGNIVKMIRNISSSIPGIFLTAPFFSTIYHMNKNRNLLNQAKNYFECKPKRKHKRILWFSDTYRDLNGVSATLQKIHEYASTNKYSLSLVSYDSNVNHDTDNYMNLPIIHEFKLPYYEQLSIKIPSLLHSIKKIYDY